MTDAPEHERRVRENGEALASSGRPETIGPSGPGAEGGDRDFDVFRLRLGHVVAFVAALALLFIMAGDWYSTNEGVRLREVARGASQGDRLFGKIDPGAVEDARLTAEKAERNAWAVSSFLDALVLVGLLATVALVLAAAALQAAGRTFDPKRSPSALAGGAAVVAFALVLTQALARLGPSSDAVFQVGLPLGIIALGAVALGSAMAVRDALSDGEAAGSSPRPGTGGSGSETGLDERPARPEASGGETYNRAS